MGQRFGQHFLVSNGIINKIIDAFQPFENTIIGEIGPGAGALTKRLRDIYTDLYLFEIDTKWIEHWQSQGMSVLPGDVLDMSFSEIADGREWSLIGNLPYQISGPLIAKIVAERAVIPMGWFMLQEEFVRRLAAGVGSEDRGGLSVWLQRYYDVKPAFRVTKGCFHPPPKVQSFMFSIHRKREVLPCVDEALLHDVIRATFQFKRKTVRKSMQIHYPEIDWSEVPPFDWTIRPASMSESNFIWLTDYISQSRDEAKI